MKYNRLIGRVLCLVLCLICLTAAAVPAAAVEDLPELRPAVAIHYRANAGSLVIGCMEDGTELTILDDSYTTVYQIDCYDMTGYIAKELVRWENGKPLVNYVPGHTDARVFTAQRLDQAMQTREALRNTAAIYQGVRYKWGGTTPRGFDCSGYMRYIFQQNGLPMVRTAQQQVGEGIIIPYDQLQCGDLVFFTRTHGGSLVTHVGMYIGDGKMIHAGSSRGVVIADLSINYFQQHYLCARRVVLNSLLEFDTTELTVKSNTK